MTRWIGITSSFVAFLAILAFFAYGAQPNTNGPHDSLASLLSQAFAQSFQVFGDDTRLLKIVHSTEAWNIIEHLGGTSPWIPKRHGIVDEGIDPPEGCFVDQVHMLSRHAERYPTLAAGIGMLELYQRIQNSNITLRGDLAFANDWEFFTHDPAEHFESLVSTGVYAGTLEAFATGVKLRSRYGHLLDAALEERSTSFWASDSKRVIDTANYFGAGFFGIDWKDFATLHVIPESPHRGANTLTPGRTCLRYRNNVDEFGHNYGYRMMKEFQHTYEPDILERLADQNPEFAFDENDAFIMQQICAFETIAKGSSSWCNVFTQEEWESYEYSRDVLHYFRTGQGNPYSGAMGWLWLNATSNLLAEGPSAGPLFFSFGHDGDVIPVVSALDIFPQNPDLPVDHVLHNRTYRTSDVVPMGGRIILERLVCPAPPNCWSNAPFYPNHVYCEEPTYDASVRVNINDGIVAIPGCNNGPGASCPLDDFIERVQKRGVKLDSFGKVCGLSESAPDRITFLHQ